MFAVVDFSLAFYAVATFLPSREPEEKVMRKFAAVALIGTGIFAGTLTPSAANAYVPPALEIPVTCGEETTNGPTSHAVYTGQEVKLVFNPSGCSDLWWGGPNPSNWGSSSDYVTNLSSFTLSAADVPAQFDTQFDIDKTGNGDYEYIVLTDGGPAPEPPAPAPTVDSLPDTGMSVTAISGIATLLGVAGAFFTATSRRSRKS
jgi:hypothetical protein